MQTSLWVVTPKWSKSEVLIMKKKRIFIIVLLLVLLLVFAYWFKGYMAVDKCLDNGGRWNYEKSICEYK